MRGALTICHGCGGIGCPVCEARGCWRDGETDPGAGGTPSAVLTLPDEPAKALRELAQYMATARMDRQRAIREERYTVGYWQTDEWIEGLFDLAQDALRVAMIADECQGVRDAFKDVPLLWASPECRQHAPSVALGGRPNPKPLAPETWQRIREAALNHWPHAIPMHPRERRARRLFPVYLLLFIVTLILAYLYVHR